VLIECLLDDDGLDATLPRVRAEWLNASFLEELATRCMADHPAQAIRWLGDLLAQAQKTASNQAYHDVVRLLRKLQALLPEAEFAQQLADLRQTYHRRRNLMLLLNQAF
jgi:regulator of protease activity HflC (stomatin/prohibitin superfamily)